MSCHRMHLPGDIHLVTNRCFQGRLLMLPNGKINFIIGYWFARALEKYGRGLQIFAFIFLGNHMHILLRDTQGTLAQFMCYFQSNVARAVNAEIGRTGVFWEDHYDDQIVDGEDTFWEKYAYVTCNAVKAGLVDRSEEWIGWSSYHQQLHGGTYRFTALNRDRYNKASRNRKKKPAREKFMETYAFSLSLPPGLEEKRIEENAKRILPLIRKQEADCRALRNNKPPLGVNALRNQRPVDRPKSPSKSRRKRIDCKDKNRLEERLEEYHQFVGRYQETYEQYRQSQLKGERFHGEWPLFSYPPSCWLAVGCHHE